MLEAAHPWLVCHDGAVQFSCTSVQLRSHCQRFATGPARFSSVLARVNAVLYSASVLTQRRIENSEKATVDPMHVRVDASVKEAVCFCLY